MNRLVSRSIPLVVVLCLAGCQTKDNKAPPPSGTAVNVKAGDLLHEYGTNAVAADAKYKGQLLRVTGKFGSAQKAPLMGFAVQILPEDAGDVNVSGVECFILDSAQPDVAKMQQGQIVSLQGICDGQIVGQVKLSKCIVVP